MKIDRHNYEEHFLLYIDNELNVEQKKQVEAFVSANPDVEEEFIMLQQSRLVADDSIVFEGKESLMKEETAINMNNYEEWLVLYVDNELSREQKLIVEKFAEAHPHVKEELIIFRQTKLEPQEIVFAAKASLYRREENADSYRHRVVSMSWPRLRQAFGDRRWRVAVAAVVIIAAGLGTYSIITNQNKLKKIDTAKIIDSAPGKPGKSNQQEQKINNPGTETKQATPEINQQKNKTLAVKENQNKVEKKDLIQPEDKKDDQAIAKNDELKTPGQSTDIQKETSHTTTADAFIAVNGDQQKQIVNKFDVTNDPEKTPNSKKLASDNDYVDPGESVANNGNDENKKLRGFFRRATRFIERTTKINPANDDDKVLIGSMAISLK